MKQALRILLIAFTLPLAQLQSQGCDLIKAIRASEPIQVQACIDAQADLATRDAHDRTPLLLAVAGDGFTVIPERQKKIVTALLVAGADVNAADAKGYTALHYAAYQGTFDLVALLLEKGADPNAKNGVDETPLHLAARGPLMDDGRLKTFESLLVARADVQAQDTGGRTALHLICAHKARLESPQAADEAILQLTQRLKDLGAQIKAEDLQGNTPFASAMREGHAQTALWLLQQGVAASPAVLAQFSALHIATERGQLPLVEALLQAGLDINRTTGAKRQAEGQAYFFPKGSTPLDLARIAEHESKDPALQKEWKNLAAALKQRGGVSKTYYEYVKGFKAVQGGGSPPGGGSKITPKR
jgi:ankyrin repeat protein